MTVLYLLLLVLESWVLVTTLIHVNRVHNFSFLQMCVGNGDYFGTSGSVPLVAERCLKFDKLGYSYDNGPFMQMER